MICYSRSAPSPAFVFIQKAIHLVNDLYQPLGVSFSLRHFLQATPSFRFIKEHFQVFSAVEFRTRPKRR